MQIQGRAGRFVSSVAETSGDRSLASCPSAIPALLEHSRCQKMIPRGKENEPIREVSGIYMWAPAKLLSIEESETHRERQRGSCLAGQGLSCSPGLTSLLLTCQCSYALLTESCFSCMGKAPRSFQLPLLRLKPSHSSSGLPPLSFLSHELPAA